MATPDFGQWLWENGTREHKRIMVICKAHSVDGAAPRRGVHGFIDMTLVEGQAPVRFLVTVRTKQTEMQIRHHIADDGECAISGMLAVRSEVNTDGHRFRPVIGRVGLKRPDVASLERMARATLGQQVAPTA